MFLKAKLKLKGCNDFSNLTIFKNKSITRMIYKVSIPYRFKINAVAISLLLLISVNLYAQQKTYTYQQPELTEDGWKTNSLNTHGYETKIIQHLFDQLLYAKAHKIHSMLVVKDDELLLEEYFDDYHKDTQHDMRSTSKSIRSILLGIAIDQGFIESIDDPISKYLKTLKPKKNLDKRKDSITIRHLITMSAGWDCNDWNKKSKGQEDRVYKKKDWLQYTLDLPMMNDPGEVSTYCSMGVTLMTQIIVEASGMPINEFADRFLFQPMGITNVDWNHTSKKEVINSSKRLYMIPRDMAKIGKLILQKGEWNEQQIVSSKWIEEATTPKTKITGIDYGYLWWTIPFQLKDGSFVTAKVATGNGGQYIMVFPKYDMIAVFTGGAYNSQDDKIPFAIVKDVLIPTFTKARLKD